MQSTTKEDLKQRKKKNHTLKLISISIHVYNAVWKILQMLKILEGQKTEAGVCF